MILLAIAGPIPGKVSSSASVAVLILTVCSMCDGSADCVDFLICAIDLTLTWLLFIF